MLAMSAAKLAKISEVYRVRTSLLIPTGFDAKSVHDGHWQVTELLSDLQRLKMEHLCYLPPQVVV
jgi:hypothetical protein